MSQEIDEEFYWTISRIKNFDENNLFTFLTVLSNYDLKQWSPNRTAIMQNLIDARYTLVGDQLGQDSEDLLDKRFQSHVTPMFALGLGIIDINGIFHLTDIAKYLLKSKNVIKFMKIQMLRWQLPNGSIRVKEKLQKWVNDKRCIIPFVFTIKTLVGLYDTNVQEAYLTNEEIIRFLFKAKTHKGNVTPTVQEIMQRRTTGTPLIITEREKERAVEDLKILLSYFSATNLCYVQRSKVIKVGNNVGHASDVLALNIGKIDELKKIIEKEIEPFDFSNYNLDLEFQRAKEDWNEYYGSLPSQLSADAGDRLDKPLPLPSTKDISEGMSKIKEQLIIEDSVILEIISNLVSGKNVILTGPVGTGKTHIGQLIPELMWKESGSYFPMVVTATADWTTQDVIGGIFPKLSEKGDVTYDIQKGCIYDTISKNWAEDAKTSFKRSNFQHENKNYAGVWLIIDEFNRANIDRAFGEMFTAIEYGKLRVPTNKKDETFKEIPIPNDFRIIGTMNTFDKHYLFRLSDALKRRFAFVEILPPAQDKAETEKYYILRRAFTELPIESTLSSKIKLDNGSKSITRSASDPDFLALIDSMYAIIAFIRLTKNLGTAILISISKFVAIHNLYNANLEQDLDPALKSTVIPHLENVSKWSLEAIRAFACDDITSLFKGVDANSVDFSKYEAEFSKLLQYMGQSNNSQLIDRFRKKQMTDADWQSLNPWSVMKKPTLPLFKNALSELIEENQLI